MTTHMHHYIWYLLTSCKERCGPVQNDLCEKNQSGKSKGRPWNGCDDDKTFNNNYLGEFCADS